MYSFTKETDKNYIHIFCKCGRKYIAEEMYICYSCKIVQCNFCLSEEIEYCYCKNSCKRNKCISVTQAKKAKNRCDQCLECPNCQTALIKKFSDKKYFYACTYCLWDTSQIKFVSEEENNIEELIYQLKQTNNSGYLKKNFDQMVNKIKDSDELNFDETHLRTHSVVYKPYDDTDEVIRNPTKLWESEELDKKIKENEIQFNKKMNLEYKDNYLTDPKEIKNNMEFQAVANILSVNLDYLEKGINKAETVDQLRDRMKNDYDVSMLSSLEQRLSNIAIQHPITQ